MSGVFDSARYLQRVLPKGMEKAGLLKKDLTIKQRYLKALVRAGALSGREIKKEVYKIVDFYIAKEKALKEQGVQVCRKEALNGQALLTQRIKNMLVYAEVQEQKKAHKGRLYRWLPSSAAEPDPEHQLLYGKVFCEGQGDKDGYMPGERPGCRCGIEWLQVADLRPDEKAAAVKIDFRKDSYLPHLNQEQLEAIGSKDKDVVFKRTTGRRNRSVHKELKRQEYEPLIGQALYRPVIKPMQDVKNKNYWHFIGQAKEDKKAFVLLDVNKRRDRLEIVHVLKMRERNVRQFLRKQQRANKKPS